MEEIKKEQLKFTSIVIDTINGIQNDEFTELIKKPNYDIWYEFGKDVLDLCLFLKTIPNATLVFVLGREGTGKTVGTSFLNPKETIIFNADRKPLSYPHRNIYNETNKNYFPVDSYKRLKELITAASKYFDKPITIFLLGQTEEFKSGNDTRERLKVLGKMATKLNIEGGVIHTYYTNIDSTKGYNDPLKYRLATQNSGFNTARSPMGMWEEEFIPNNYQMILDKIRQEFNS